jgi:hypothetical protein
VDIAAFAGLLDIRVLDNVDRWFEEGQGVCCTGRARLRRGGGGNRMHAFLDGLGVTLPVLAAPMAGGPSRTGRVHRKTGAGQLE